MKIGFVVNDVQTEKAAYTTTRLAMAAVNLGHAAWVMGVGDFIYAPDGSIRAIARTVSGQEYLDLKVFLEELQAEEGQEERIRIDDLDVLLLRYDPSEEKRDRPWAQTPGILFGELAVGRGVIVLNDPRTMASAINKTYFQQFPEVVRPKTLISRNVEEIRDFIAGQEDRVVIKPLQGSGGESVFLIRKDDVANINQMIDAVIRDGYCIAQEYLPGAAKGDVRLFVMNGKPLEVDGKVAAFRRVSKSGDMRSNMHSGGESQPVELNDQMLQLVEAVRPKLVRDGLFFAGLDIVDDKLMEINVFTPGGLGSALQHTGVDFTRAVIAALERKVQYRELYSNRLDNREIATL
jgi:glutathione synthase